MSQTNTVKCHGNLTNVHQLLILGVNPDYFLLVVPGLLTSSNNSHVCYLISDDAQSMSEAPVREDMKEYFVFVYGSKKHKFQL